MTSFDLEALERRFQVLISKATASLSTQLQGRISTASELQQQPTSSRLPDDRIAEPPTSLGTTATRAKCNPATLRIQRREKLSATAGNETIREANFQRQTGTVGRSKPRLQLNVQIFRNTPFSKSLLQHPWTPKLIPTSGDSEFVASSCH